MGTVEVRDLHKVYEGGRAHGKVHAIDGVDLATEEGEYLALLGPSGCGKTTLLRTVAGLEQPTSGTVLIDGHDVTGLPPRARKIARVFLLDEPLSNLDAKLRASARDELKRFQQEVGTTTIYVTHDQVEAMGLGDRIAVMYAGTVRQLGRPVEVYDDPADTFVATFIGSPPMNLVPHDNRLVGFRPEHLLPIEFVGAGPGRVEVSVAVDRMEYLSGDRHVYGTASGLGEPTRVVARLPATVGTPIATGEEHRFAVAQDRLRFFDADSGVRTEPVRVGP